MLIRSLLALAGITAFFYRPGDHAVVNISISILLLSSAFATNYLLSFTGIKKIYLLLMAGGLLFAATNAFTFSVLLVVFGMLSSFLYKKPLVLISQQGVTLKSSKGNTLYGWEEFDNIVLKDSLLTLDYKSNKLQQLEVDVSANPLNESQLNDFCKTCLTSQTPSASLND